MLSWQNYILTFLSYVLCIKVRYCVGFSKSFFWKCVFYGYVSMCCGWRYLALQFELNLCGWLLYGTTKAILHKNAILSKAYKIGICSAQTRWIWSQSNSIFIFLDWLYTSFATDFVEIGQLVPKIYGQLKGCKMIGNKEMICFVWLYLKGNMSRFLQWQDFLIFK